MNNNIRSSNDNPNVENIDLVYLFINDFLKRLNDQVNNLRSRAATFLAFAGVLLKFSTELSDSEPSYLITKIGALLTSFCSIGFLGFALKSTPRIVDMKLRDTIESDFLQIPIVEVKKIIIYEDLSFCEYLFKLATEIKNLLNVAIFSLVFSAFFFVANVILVSFIEK
jgi:hypothetical protein